MARMTTQLTGFADALTFLDGATSRTLGHNTTVHQVGPTTIAVRYHATNIVEFHQDGPIFLTTGGWMTSTTKQRLNDIMPGVSVWSEGDSWGIATRRDSARFSDGMWIDQDGTFQTWKAMRWAGRRLA